ncbi:MAG: hydrogenase [Desulfarculus sp.]|jgi:NAD(P)H-flavin reductase|nr:MAG: hydrogenase [Desulfarculus sp.]
MDNLYIPDLATLEQIQEETPSIRTLTLALDRPRTFNCQPGQFIEFTVFGQGEFPVSVAGVSDAQRGRFQVTIQRAGKVTKEVFQLQPGAKLGVRGPFGNGFPLEKMQGQDVWLISGGVGLAALWYLLAQLQEQRGRWGQLKLLYGARSPQDIIYQDALRALGRDQAGPQVLLTVDSAANGWSGRVGFVSQLLPDSGLDPGKSVAVVCGPGPMMKATTAALRKLGLAEERILLSMERRMQCGMGACGHCMVGSKRVCLDGPVFPLAEISNLLEEKF